MENKEKVKQKIQRTFLDMVKTTPVEDIKVKELVAIAGVSRSAFYVYYDSIWDVLQEIEDEFWDTAYNIKRPILEGKESFESDDVPHEILSFLQDNSHIMEALTAREGDAAYLATWVKGIQQQICMWTGEDEKAPSPRTKMLTEYTIGGIQRMLSYWSTHQDSMSQEEFLELFDQLRYNLRSLFKNDHSV